MGNNIISRKNSHLDACLNEKVEYSIQTGFENYTFIHNALPEINFQDIDISTTFLNKKISCPLIVSGITGGGDNSFIVNKNLAIACEEVKIPFSVGSMRAAIENPALKSTFAVREYAPTVPLMANLGAVQLNYGFGLEACREAVEMIEADALVFHLNPMQEVIQNGNTDFAGLTEKIARICEDLPYPVIIKEVGFGISSACGDILDSLGIYGLDISGSGGTSWSLVESYGVPEPYKNLGTLFADWGIPTAQSLEMNQNRNCKIIAGGGIRSGIDIAKSIVLGADYGTMALPLLKAALEGPEKVVDLLNRYALELKTAMFGIGATDIGALKTTTTLKREGL